MTMGTFFFSASLYTKFVGSAGCLKLFVIALVNNHMKHHLHTRSFLSLNGEVGMSSFNTALQPIFRARAVTALQCYNNHRAK